MSQLKLRKKARAMGLHLLTLPSHCSHAMQPLDVAVFKPFKGTFHVYRDAWTLNNRGKGARKEVLASWTSKALSRVLTMSNIEAGFQKIGIYPLNSMAMDGSLGLSATYIEVQEEGEGSGIPHEEIPEAPLVEKPIRSVQLLCDGCPLRLGGDSRATARVLSAIQNDVYTTGVMLQS
jgi:hypothetical protein